MKIIAELVADGYCRCWCSFYGDLVCPQPVANRGVWALSHHWCALGRPLREPCRTIRATMSDALTLLSEMATNSPRSQALASLHMTPEELQRHTQEMRDFLCRTAVVMTNTSPKSPSPSASSSTAESTVETVAGTSRSSVATSTIPTNGDAMQPKPSIRTRRQTGTVTSSNASSPGPSRTLR